MAAKISENKTASFIKVDFCFPFKLAKISFTDTELKFAISAQHSFTLINKVTIATHPKINKTKDKTMDNHSGMAVKEIKAL